jgi:hypothetical protein
MNWKGYGRKWLWHNLKYTVPEFAWKNKKTTKKPQSG